MIIYPIINGNYSEGLPKTTVSTVPTVEADTVERGESGGGCGSSLSESSCIELIILWQI